MTPLLSCHTGLLQKPLQKRNTDIGLIGIRNMHIHLSSRHELMSAAGKGSLETQRFQTGDQLPARNRKHLGHAASRAFRSYLRTDGTNCCFRTLSNSHSSNTSCNSARASFFVFPCAQTPLNPGRDAKYGSGSLIRSTFAFAITARTYRVNMGAFYHIPALS